MFNGYDVDRQQPAVGIYTLADAVQETLRIGMNTDLERATGDQVKLAVHHVLSSPETEGLALFLYKPELPISSCLGPSKVPSSTRAIVVSLTDAVNHPIKLTEPFSRRGELAFDGQRRWLSPRLHSLQTPPGTHLALGCLSSPLMTSRIIATLVLDGARRYAPTLAGISPGTLPPQQAETPTSWHAAPDVHPS